jgi:Signal transduction histidine kinase
VLDLARVESGKLDLHPETFDVEAMVRDVVTTIQPLAQKNATPWRSTARTGSERCTPTSPRSARACSTSCRTPASSPRRGVRLEVERDDRDGGWLTFRVTDTGIGMTPDT